MATEYIARQPAENGLIEWSLQEHDTWQQLYSRQLPALRCNACDEYLAGLQALGLPADHIPQLQAIDEALHAATGWQTQAVPALIDFSTFFQLLSQRRFPVATFIRTPDELDYLKEPDIFHEIYGHCPLLMNPAFATFTQRYGELGLAANKEERVYLARLYWFTVEFGLLRCDGGEMRIYGGGILSSPKETHYAVASQLPKRQPFDLMTVLRTPYRIDILQPVYFYLDSIDELFDLAQRDIMRDVRDARKLGLLPIDVH